MWQKSLQLYIKMKNINLENIKGRNPEACFIEVFERGNGNKVHHIVGPPEYEKMLYERDDQLNSEGKEFIGSSYSTRL